MKNDGWIGSVGEGLADGAGLDPFFQSRNRVRDGKYDYTEWTPGLERMFAPTYPLKSWF